MGLPIQNRLCVPSGGNATGGRNINDPVPAKPVGAAARRDRLTYVLLAVVVLMGFEIVFLVIQNQRLRRIVRDPKKYFQTVSRDEVVPSFNAADIDGNDVSVRYGPGQPYTLLFWLGPTCDACEDNVAFWKSIYDQNDSDHLRILAMFAGNPAEAREYVARHGIEFTVVCADNRFIVDSYKGHALPQTVLIDPTGTIRGVWPGVLGEKREGEIMATVESLRSPD
jgi:peroxiredoxin